VDIEKSQICKKALKVADVEKFVYAIKNNYWFEMYMDDLPVHGNSIIK